MTFGPAHYLAGLFSIKLYRALWSTLTLYLTGLESFCKRNLSLLKPIRFNGIAITAKQLLSVFLRMNKIGLVICTGIIILYGCKQKGGDKEKEGDFFPVLSFLRSQVKHIDTSVYPLLKIVTVDSVSDTAYIKREEFRTYASDFITIPDISSDKLKDQYTETKLYDETLKQAVLDYTANNAKAEIRREEVMLVPDENTGGHVKSIYISRWINSADSTVQKNMYWQVNKRFQIVTITQKNNQPDKIKTVQVIWNDFPAPSSME